MTQISTGGYVRHRDRMVQESVFEDLSNTLIACRWKIGTTTRLVLDPNMPPIPGEPRVWTTVSTHEDQVLRLAGKNEAGGVAQVVLIDAFPEASGTNDKKGQSRKTEINTLAIDTGVAQEPRMVELGSNLMEQSYVFTLALYAASDAVALALLNDLRDRYQGRIVSDDHVNLYNFNDPTYSDGITPPVTRMEVDYFRYSQDAERVTPWEVHLYYAELQVTDFIDENDPVAPGSTSPGSPIPPEEPVEPPVEPPVEEPPVEEPPPVLPPIEV